MTQSLLGKCVAEELSQGADERALRMAEALAALYPGAARAVLFYGSCLRESQLDGLMLDFYLIVSDYREAYGSSWLAWANAKLPPNVFPFAHDGLSAKYAVLSEADFHRLCGMEADTVSVWARFAQPSRLLWVADEPARQQVVASVARAVPTLLNLAAPAAGQGAHIWEAGFALTYSAELRAEKKTRSGSIVAADPERYDRFLLAAMSAGQYQPDREISADEKAAHEKRWAGLRRRGKVITVLRLAKASFTFAGGIDYLAWKINRHAGTQIAIKPWQRRWPLLGAVVLLPRLLRSGAVK